MMGSNNIIENIANKGENDCRFWKWKLVLLRTFVSVVGFFKPAIYMPEYALNIQLDGLVGVSLFFYKQRLKVDHEFRNINRSLDQVLCPFPGLPNTCLLNHHLHPPQLATLLAARKRSTVAKILSIWSTLGSF